MAKKDRVELFISKGYASEEPNEIISVNGLMFVLPKGKTWMKILGAVLGSVLYRFIIAIALRLDLPSECLKLISACIVALAIGLPAMKKAKGGAASC